MWVPWKALLFMPEHQWYSRQGHGRGRAWIQVQEGQVKEPI